MFTQTRALIEILAGRLSGWGRQRREVGKVSWEEARLTVGWISLTGILLAGGFWFTPDILTGTAPILVGLVLAMPLAVLGGSQKAGQWLRKHNVFVTPEEANPPAILNQARRNRPDVLSAWAPQVAAVSVAVPAPAVEGGREPAAVVTGAAAEPSR